MEVMYDVWWISAQSVKSATQLRRCQELLSWCGQTLAVDVNCPSIGKAGERYRKGSWRKRERERYLYSGSEDSPQMRWSCGECEMRGWGSPV